MKKRSESFGYPTLISEDYLYAYVPDFLTPDESAFYFSKLHSSPWLCSGKVQVFGKTYDEPRLRAWLSEQGKPYTYSGQTLTANPYPEGVLQIQKKIHDIFPNLRFNSCLWNVYRSGTDSMGFHSDDEPELGNNPVIASVSLGASRFMHFRKKVRQPRQRSHKILLESGSLLLMAPGAQSLFQHAIPKDLKVMNPRVNLTFRHRVDGM